nr:MAG TPA: hypothetical protein [Caudoviricetes sp.]
MFGLKLYVIDNYIFHDQFKIPRRSRCVGSSPTPGTIGIK